MKNTPIAPHLQVYKPQLTSVLSILHRITGVALAAGLPVLILWLVALASGETSFTGVTGVLNHLLVKIALFGWTFSLFYHLSNGIRHLLWDIGVGLDLKSSYLSGYLVLTASTLLTFTAWALSL